MVKRHAAARMRLRTTARADADAEVSLPVGAERKLARAGRNATVTIYGHGRAITRAVGAAEHAFDAPWAAAPAANCRRIDDDDEPMIPTTVRVDAAALRTALGSLPKAAFGQTCRIGLGAEGIRAWATRTEDAQGEPAVLSTTPAEGRKPAGCSTAGRSSRRS